VNFSIESFDPLSENQLEEQPDDEVSVTEEFGITIGDLRRALNVEDQYQILLKKQEADALFVEEFVDDVNQRLMIDGIVVVILSGLLGYFIFN
jgi:hypothetical protein